MASVLPSVVDESLFQCRLCCRSAADPRLLQCLHVFCRTCLLRHVSRLRAAAAAAQPQNVVAQDEPKDQITPESADDKMSAAASLSQGEPCVEESSHSSTAGNDVEHSSSSALTSPTRNVVGDDIYETPCDDYEDVDSDQIYANDAMVSVGHLLVTSNQGYALMASRPSAAAVSSSPQVYN